MSHRGCQGHISGLWIAVMPTFFSADVLRIFAGDFTQWLSGERRQGVGGESSLG